MTGLSLDVDLYLVSRKCRSAAGWTWPSDVQSPHMMPYGQRQNHCSALQPQRKAGSLKEALNSTYIFSH